MNSMTRWIAVSTLPPKYPGDPPEQTAQQERDRHPDQSDGERYAGGEDGAAEHVPAQVVGPEQKQVRRLRYADEMDVRSQDPQQPVLVTAGEEAQVVAARSGLP